MKHALLNASAERGLEDSFYFLTEFWGLDLVEQPHREICDLLDESCENDETPYLLMVVPRGTYKTSIMRGEIVRRQLRQIYLHDNPYHRIAIASATLALGKQSLQSIEGQLRYNKKLAQGYGLLWVPENKRNSMRSKVPDGIVLAPRIERGEIAQVSEPSFWIASRRRISTGFHADEAFVDDLNNRDNTRTPHQREDVKEYWRLLQPILSPKDRAGHPAKIVLTATRWHDDDVAGAVIRDEAARKTENPSYHSPYLVVQRAAVDDDDNLYFPSVLDHEKLQKLREELGPRLYAMNYLNNPVGESGFVDEDQIKFKSLNEFPPLRNLRVTIDPSQHADGKAAGCFTAMCISGYDHYARLWVREMFGSREWTTVDLIERLFDNEKRYPGIPQLIEDAHLAHLRYSIRLEEERRNVRLIIREVPVERTSYYKRWERLQPRFRNGDITFASEIAPSIKAELKDELVRGDAARFNDFLDALAMAEIGVMPRIDKTGQMISQADAPQKLRPGVHSYSEFPEIMAMARKDAAAKKSWERRVAQAERVQ